MKKKSYDGRDNAIQGPNLGYHIMDTGDSDESGKTVNTEYAEEQEKKKKEDEEKSMGGVGEGMSDRGSLNNSQSMGYHSIAPSVEYQAENKDLKGEIIDQVLADYTKRKKDERPFKE